ncbi:MAG: hypothetical protein COA86_12505 [Kangiella sp.]|nr:MAG: hypothetical protein COA86_12505 [Kangiella sp.]
MNNLKPEPSFNVFDEPLIACSNDPVTGFFRDGCCNTNEQDVGSHTICIEASQEFLEYSRFKGNDLSTPVPEFGFTGIKAGDRWCLCAARWLEAHNDDRAPRVFLQRTHKKTLEIVPMKILNKFALDLN